MALRGELSEAANLVECERLAGKPPEATLGLYHHATVPVRSGGHLMGLMNLALPQGRLFDADELRLLTAAAETLGVALERAHLHERVKQQRVEEQETILRLSQTLVGLIEPQAVMDVAARTVQEALQVQYVSLMTPDPTGRWLVLVGGAGWEPELYGHYRVEVKTSREGYVLRSGEPVQQPDGSAALTTGGQSGEPFPCPAELQQRGVVSSVTVPLRGDGGPLGTLCAHSTRARQFSPEEVRLLSLIAGQTAVALGRAWAHRQMIQHARELQARQRVTQAILQTLDLDERLVVVLEQAMALLDAETGAIYLVAGERIRLAAQRGLADDLLAALGDLPLGQEPPWLTVPQAWQRQGKLTRLQSQVGLPLRAGERDVGAIVLASPRPEAFDANRVRTLSALAEQAAVAIENARLFEALQARVHELSALAEASAALRGATTMQEMGPLLAAQAVRLAQADVAFLCLVDEAQQQIVTLGVAGLPPEAVGRQHGLEEGFTGQVIRTGAVYRSRDLSQDPLAAHRDLLAGLGPGMCMPLRTTAGQVVGTLLVARRLEKAAAPFLPEDERLLTTLAEIAGNALQRARAHEELEAAYLETVLALANAMDARDTYTGDHSQRLAAWAEATARELGCNQAEIEAIRWGALLHDIGKIGVPDAILRKPGPLDEAEWVIMQRHPEIGAEIVAPVRKLEDVAPIICAHQEKWDGTGYPAGLQGEAIPVGARILAVVDAYGAMTDERVYRAARSHEEAVAELRHCAGTQFDPRVVEAFLRVLEQGVDVTRGPSGTPVVA